MNLVYFMSWREKQKEELHQHLYTTALDLFKEQGYDETTVMTICKKAGVAKGTFFNYFTNKEAVLAYYMREITAKGLKATRKSLVESSKTNVLRVFLELFKQARKNQALFFITCRITPQEPELRHEEDRLDGDIAQFLLDILTEGVNKDQIDASVPLDVLTSLLLSSLTASANDWAVNTEFNPEKEIERRVDFLFKAVYSYQGKHNDFE